MDASLDRYRRALLASMEHLGVTESVERTFVAGVSIQFAAAVLLALLPFVLTGVIRAVVTAAPLGGAAVALGNSPLIARRDFVAPVRNLEAAATAIAASAGRSVTSASVNGSSSSSLT
jgi:hypothetical protein